MDNPTAIRRGLLDSFASIVPKSFDVFVCSSSFELRCRSIADHIDPTLVGHALIAENENLRDVVGGNMEYLCQRFANRFTPVRINTFDPLLSADRLFTSLRERRAAGARSYLVDVTTFTHESLLILLRLLKRWLTPTESVEFVYATASDYSIGDAPGKKWLSKGILEVRSVLGYSGHIVPSRKLHLVILVGIEYDRAARLIQEFEPARVSIGRGVPAQPTPVHEEHMRRVDEIRDLVGSIDIFSFPCHDPFGTHRALEDLLGRAHRYNIVIAPMNTKLSTIGAAQFAFENETVQLCYAQASLYNFSGYSQPGNEFYYFTFDSDLMH